MTSRLRLLKVHVQPVFVIDDGETLTEQPGQPVEVAGGAWRAFAADAFGPEEMELLQAQWEAAQPPAEAPGDSPHGHDLLP
jgi:hypothetical protein